MILKKNLKFSKKAVLSNLLNKNPTKEIIFFKIIKRIDPTRK